jgi:FkbM family methyltransferase
MKKIIKRILDLCGYEMHRTSRLRVEIGSDQRPVGRMDYLLEDLRSRGLRCRTIIDVGANTTSWSRMAKKVFPEANFCLIEPQVEMQQNLEQFCREFDGSVFVLVGAGAQKDVRTLTVWDDLAGSSFLPKPDAALRSTNKQRDIEIVTIDNLISSSRTRLPELMKLDVQGFELEALKGASTTFGYTEAYILEVLLFPFSDVPGAPVLSDVIQFMLARDYVVYDFAGFLRRPLDGALGACDICFVKRDGFLRQSHAWR